MSTRHLHTTLFVVGVGLVVALGRAIPVCFEGRLPQVPGEDVLSLVLGDARQVLSSSLESKAEEYFHGGVRDLDCTMTSASEEDEHGDAGHEALKDADSDPKKAEPPVEAGWSFDPWQWVDRRVHVQEHRHLKGAQTVELLPWLWAACRLSPKNVQAYESGAYVLANLLKKPEESVRLLEEGIRNNPASPELDFSLGEVWVNRLHDMGRAERWFTSTREKCLPVQSSAARAEELFLLRLRAVFYLGYIAKQRGDLHRVRACLEEAEALDPEHSVVRDLRAMLGSSETSP